MAEGESCTPERGQNDTSTIHKTLNAMIVSRKKVISKFIYKNSIGYQLFISSKRTIDFDIGRNFLLEKVFRINIYKKIEFYSRVKRKKFVLEIGPQPM